MRVFSTESMWDKEIQEFVEYYYIDGTECTLDEYDEAMQEEVEDDEEFECDCPECTIEKYVDLLMADRCEDCTRDILKMFMSEIIEHIVVEN